MGVINKAEKLMNRISEELEIPISFYLSEDKRLTLCRNIGMPRQAFPDFSPGVAHLRPISGHFLHF